MRYRPVSVSIDAPTREDATQLRRAEPTASPADGSQTMKPRTQSQRSVLYLSETPPPQRADRKNGTLLVRILRRQLEVEQQQTQAALEQVEELKSQSLALARALKEARARMALLERQLERSKRPSRKGINNNIDALAARLVRGNNE